VYFNEETLPTAELEALQASTCLAAAAGSSFLLTSFMASVSTPEHCYSIVGNVHPSLKKLRTIMVNVSAVFIAWYLGTLAMQLMRSVPSNEDEMNYNLDDVSNSLKSLLALQYRVGLLGVIATLVPCGLFVLLCT
jgi:hypothetical protein